MEWVEVTDPREPLFGRRFRIESVSRTAQEVAHVFVRRDDGIVLRIPLRTTSLSTLVDFAPRAKLCRQSATEFLSLVKEYALCPHPHHSHPTKSGQSSKKHRKKKS